MQIVYIQNLTTTSLFRFSDKMAKITNVERIRGRHMYNFPYLKNL